MTDFRIITTGRKRTEKTNDKKRGECFMTDNRRIGRILTEPLGRKGEYTMTGNAFDFFGTRSKYEREANEIIRDRKGGEKLEKAIGLVRRIPVLKDLANDIPVMVNMVKDYIKGAYRKVPMKTMAMMTAALLYFINPNDVVPDYVPGVGYLDDAAVITYVLKSVKDDVDEYKTWRCSFWRS